MKIAILCPSRGRPKRFEAMLRSAIETADAPRDIRAYLAFDADDPEYGNYLTEFTCRHMVTLANREKRTVAQLYNMLAREADGEIFMAAADDLIFRTHGWDTKAANAIKTLPGAAGIAVPRDRVSNGSVMRCTHWFCTPAWIERVGYLVPEHYGHFYADTHVADVATRCGRLVWMPDVLIEHMHPNYGKAERDATYNAKRNGACSGLSNRDRDIYLARWPERAAAAHRILNEQIF